MTGKLATLLILIFTCLAYGKKIEITDNGPEVKIPNPIWKTFPTEKGKDTITFSAVTVRLVEKTRGVLVEPEIEIKLPKGGGQIDLSQFVSNKQGTFHVYFNLDEMTDDQKLKAFFISRTRKRKIENEVWGSGCNKFMDIRNFLLTGGRAKGIEVNTTRSRHLSVLGGTFFFASGPLVTQVTFTDSQQAQLFCDPDDVK